MRDNIDLKYFKKSLEQRFKEIAEGRLRVDPSALTWFTCARAVDGG